MSVAAAWSWGDRRFWIDEALNDMVALSDRYVAAVGHSHVFVWDREGALVRKFSKWMRPEHAWFTEEALCMRAAGRVVVCTLASGAIEERAPAAEDPEFPQVTVDRSAYTVTVQWAGRAALRFSYPNQSISGISAAYAGGRIAIGHGLKCVDILDAYDGSLIRRLEGEGRGVLSPDGRWLAAGGLADSRVHVGEVDAWVGRPIEVPNGRVDGLRCSPDGTRVLVVVGRTAWILRTADGAPLLRLAVDGLDAVARWTEDGAAIVGTTGNRVVRCDAATGAVTREFEYGWRMRVQAFACDARGERVATIGMTYPGGLMLMPSEEAIVWDMATGTEFVRVPLEDQYHEWLALSPDGRRLVTIHAEGVRLVTLPAEAGGALAVTRRAAWFGFENEGVQIEGDGDTVCCVVRVRAGEVVQRMPLGAIAGFVATVDGRWFAVGRNDGAVEVYRGEDFSLRCTVQAADRATEMALTPDGGVLIVGGWDATVHAYRLAEDG